MPDTQKPAPKPAEPVRDWLWLDGLEKCPDCRLGRLRGANGGGVVCTDCPYWFCY